MHMSDAFAQGVCVPLESKPCAMLNRHEHSMCVAIRKQSRGMYCNVQLKSFPQK